MCDTVVAVYPGRVLFAKNSDRDPNEAQIPEWHPRYAHESGAMLRCTWIEIPQVRETHAVLISRPFWMWGAEMGANEHGVVIGNEAVFTKQPYASSGLTGMDLLRLGLERGDTAQRACETIIALMEEHGQGGGCGLENRRFTYHNSFLMADTHGAILLETAGRKWAVEHVYGARAISNGLTIPEFAEIHSDPLRSRVSACRVRRARTEESVRRGVGPADMFRLLRDHASVSGEPAYSWINGGMGAPCMHAGGMIANGQSTASWVSEIIPGAARHWITATSAPCLSLFKAVDVAHPAEIGPLPGPKADDSLWWRHERLHRRVMRDPHRLTALFQKERDEIEANWLANPPDTAAAFREHAERIAQWYARVAPILRKDIRPWWTRSYWAKRDRWAGLGK